MNVFPPTRSAARRLSAYPTQTVSTSQGRVTFVGAGTGDDVILVAHGITGGYDQAYDAFADMTGNARILAPSRFGYPGSDLPTDGSPKAQARAFADILDELEIERAFVLGTSAGGTVAIRFALDFPDRTRGLILFCSAPPCAEPPAPGSWKDYQGPPPAIITDVAFWLMAPLFPKLMGLPSRVSGLAMPLRERKAGILNDARVTNPDMARNYAEYPIEQLEVPALVIHARDDKLAQFADMERAIGRFPDCTFVVRETGGHMMEGHERDNREAVEGFVRRVRH